MNKNSSPLCGKKILFAGDSICEAYVEAHTPETARISGWAGRICENTGAMVINVAIGGASLSDIRKTNTVIAQLEKQAYFSNDFDFVVLHGGVNDGWDGAVVGTVSDSFSEDDFDLSTFAGGMEKTISLAKRLFPKSCICFIINAKTPSPWGRLSQMDEYWSTAEKVCKKWQIPFINLHEIPGLESIPTNNNDNIHPNTAGYDLLTPHIQEWLENQVG